MSQGDCFNHPLATNTCISETNECFTQVFPFLDTVLRGCVGKDYSHKMLSGSRHVNETNKCSSYANCNSATIEFEQCYNVDYKINATFPKYSMRCPVSHTRRGCYHYEVADTVVKGCVFGLENQMHLRRNDRSLRICFGDNCNSKHMIPRCLTCESNYWDEYCLTTLENVERKMCDDINDPCYISLTDRNSFERGCLSSAASTVQNDCNSNRTSCETCDDPHHCNDRKLKYERCYVSEFHKNEAIILEPSLSKKCPASLVSLGCFHLEISETNVVKKGCVADFRKEMHLLANKHHFRICAGDNCNSESRRHNW